MISEGLDGPTWILIPSKISYFPPNVAKINSKKQVLGTFGGMLGAFGALGRFPDGSGAVYSELWVAFLGKCNLLMDLGTLAGSPEGPNS